MPQRTRFTHGPTRLAVFYFHKEIVSQVVHIV
jgi:hypothetical protein